MAVTLPPGNPRSLCHSSRRYCASVRAGSSAHAGWNAMAKTASAPKTRTHSDNRLALRPALGQKFELLDNHFIFSRHRNFALHNVEQKLEQLLPCRRHTRSEFVFKDYWRVGFQ